MAKLLLMYSGSNVRRDRTWTYSSGLSLTADPYQGDVSPGVIVYVGDSAQQQLAPERLIAHLFGLTASEAFLASLLALGFTLNEAAAKLDVTGNTIRWYSKSIFAKMGVSRQADLVRLILKSVASLA